MNDGDAISEVFELDPTLGRRVRELVLSLSDERRYAEEELRAARAAIRDLDAQLNEASSHIREVVHINQGRSRESLMSRYARTRGWRLYKRGGMRRKIEPAYFLARDFLDLDEIELWLDARGK